MLGESMLKWKQDAIAEGWKEGQEKGIREGFEQGLEKGILEGREKGLEEGREEGRTIGQRESMIMTLVEQSTVKFGQQDEKAIKYLESCSIEQLSELARRLIQATVLTSG